MDYLRICQMLLNQGELHGPRVLSRKSVELMTVVQVDPIALRFLPGQYFGPGVAVHRADGQAGLLGSSGTFGWSGGYNTYFRVDPLAELVILLFTQLEFTPSELELQHGFHNTAMPAVSDSIQPADPDRPRSTQCRDDRRFECPAIIVLEAFVTQ